MQSIITTLWHNHGHHYSDIVFLIYNGNCIAIIRHIDYGNIAIFGMVHKTKEQRMKLSEQLKLDKQRIEKSAIAPKKTKKIEAQEKQKRGPKPNPNAVKYIPFGARLNERIVNHMRIVSLKLNVSQRVMLEKALLRYLEDIGEAWNESV